MPYPSNRRSEFDRRFNDFDSDFDNFDKALKRGFAAMLVWWVVCAVLGIALTVTLIWGVIQVVQALTS